MVSLSNGLQYKILTKGTGPHPTATDTVKVDYQGKLLSGKVFDSSYARKMPATFPVNGVIKGWQQALQLMHVGATWMIYIPADLSSASFAMVAATIIPGSSVELSNVCLNYFRTGIIEVLKKMGAKIKINKKVIQGTNEEVGDIHVEYSDLNGIDVKSLYSPRMIDEYPILAVAAATASGKTILRGLTELKVKESNRFAAIVNGLRSCKVLVEDDGENIIITGTKNNVEGGAIINSNFDHRIAMSFLILGAVSNKPIKVMGCDSISTSYPNFLTQMNELGMDIRSDG